MKKILIVDDDIVLLKIILKSLNDYSDKFKTLKAHNGKEAVDILEKESISLLVTDIKMPEMDGLALLAYVNETHPSIPCFVMTAYDTTDLRKNLPKDIINFYKKPFHIEKLGPAIVETIAREVPTGVLYGISVVSFLHMIEMEKKTCLFEVNLPDKDKGIFYFEKGVLFDVVCGSLQGEDAALELITTQRARFRFKKLPQKKIVKRKGLVLLDLTRKALIAEEDRNKKKAEKLTVLEKLKLPGVFISENGLRGQMVVTNMSIAGILLKLEMEQNLAPDEKLQLEFNLDDKPKSLVRREANVRQIKGLNVSAEFRFKEHYDKLGPYLRYNKLDTTAVFKLSS